MTKKVPEQALATDVRLTDDRLIVELEDGRELSVPLEWFARLKNATPRQRSNWRFIAGGEGIHWPDVDEDLSVQALLAPTAGAQSPDENLGDETCPANGSAGEAVEWPY